MVIQGISASVEEIGNLIKMSKRHFIWKFLIDGAEHTVEVLASHITRKKIVLLDTEVIYDSTKDKDRTLLQDFQFPFQIDVNLCNIVQNGETYELSINNMSFEQISANQTSDKGYVPNKQTSVLQDQSNIEQIQTTSVPGQKYKEELGDLGGLRGARTDKREIKENQSPIRVQKPLTVVPQAEKNSNEKKDMAQTVAFAANVVKEKFLDFGSFLRSKLSNTENTNKEEQNIENTQKEEKISVTNFEKPRIIHFPKQENYNERNYQPQPVSPTPPTVPQLYKEQIGDLSGLRGARTKYPGY